jgi:cell division protein YceG involved in septum cleavage
MAKKKSKTDSYSAYVKWHKELSSKKGHEHMYGELMTRSEFAEAKEAYKYKRLNEGRPITNIARDLARSQRQWTWNFERRYKKATGRTLTGAEIKSNKQIEGILTVLPLDTYDLNDFVDDGIYADDGGEIVTRQSIFEDYYNDMKRDHPEMSHEDIENSFKAMY